MSSAPLVVDRTALPDEVEALKDIIVDLASQLEALKSQVLALRRAYYGRSSEQLSGQAELFVEAVSLPLPAVETQTVSYERPRRGRPALPKDLPRIRVDYDLSEAEKACYGEFTRIGEEVSETLDYIPAKLQVIEHVRAKYAARGQHGESTVVTAAMPPAPLPKANASANLLAHVLVSQRGGRAAAIAFSLIQTCKLHGVEPYAYLADVLGRLPSHPSNRVAELLPFNWKPAA